MHEEVFFCFNLVKGNVLLHHDKMINMNVTHVIINMLQWKHLVVFMNRLLLISQYSECDMMQQF